MWRLHGEFKRRVKTQCALPNAARRNIVRRDTGEGYRGMLERLAQESGIETPTAEDLARLDRKRKGKKLSNQDWVSRSDPEAKIAKMKDGRWTRRLGYGCIERRPRGWIFLVYRNSNLLIRDTPPVGMYVLNMFCMRGSRLWGSRLHRACVV